MESGMPDLNFDCPHCGQNLDAPADMAGVEIACPSCEKGISIPSESATPAPPGSSADAEAGEELKKSSTMRLEVPQDLDVPAPPRRIVKIKRQGK